MRLNVPPVTLNILIINVIVFVGVFVLGYVQPSSGGYFEVAGRPVQEYFSLYPKGELFDLRVKKIKRSTGDADSVERIYQKRIVPGWMFYRNNSDMPTVREYLKSGFNPIQLVTALFSHGGIMHLVFNSMAMVFIGGFLERIIGGKRFLAFYLFCGLVANLLLAFFNPDLTPVVGSSTALFGVMVYVAVLHPNLPVSVFFLPSIPIRILSFILAAGSIIMIMLDIVAGINPVPISHFGHLMGMAAAMIWLYPLAALRKRIDL